MAIDLSKIVKIHSDFQKSIHHLDSDLNFWNHFVIKWAIPEYQTKNKAQVIHSSAYSTYDNVAETGEGWLKLHHDIREIHSDDLKLHSKVLFCWVEGLSIVRVYNALEILLLQAIDVVYFGEAVKPLTRKNDVDDIHQRIEAVLGGKKDRKNNKHLIAFLRLKSEEFNKWVDKPVRKGMSANWEEFFYLISILRHAVVHQGLLINRDLLNEIKSRECYEIFSKHFDLIDLENNSFELQPIQENFKGFIGMSVQFAVNTLKFVSKQSDVSFLGLK